MTEKLPSYGGQAVIEGVMMRGRNAVAIAMRSPQNTIEVHTEPLSKIYSSNFSKIPFLRGLLSLWDALGLGIRALTISANMQTEEEEEELSGPALYGTLFVSLAFGIGLFFLLPATIGQLSETYLGASVWVGNAIEGVIRLVLLVGYIWLIGLMPDIQRVYAYHGSEHKTINAFEDSAELNPEVVQKYSRLHPRCGTAFLLNVVILSIILFALLGPLPMLWRLLSRVLLLPVIAGIAYEYLRWTANHIDNPLVKILITPNLELQKLTTREPSLDIIEVGIAAFLAMRREEGLLDTDQSPII